ncbi:sensor histidine kinase [Clostridium estertheticum]|uniref:sensor histidine kinase n=1 Tax=Clostridium estertheticum TaxID=238834 RepID=UPI001C0CCDD4|nr:HAMP domain-containing sensor histidine kinase [Clostridium estertheticum]MBU3183378.1 HAMP domain-containing histidine kinase [Clostridium estertheticum]
MAMITYIKRNMSLKKQFFIFCILSIVLSFILTLVFVSIIGITLAPLRSVVSIEEFAETNKDKLLKKSFKVQIDKKFKDEMLKNEIGNSVNYWIILKDKTILYSYINQALPKNTEIQPIQYSKKLFDEKNSETNRLILKPLVFNGEVKGALVLKCENRFIFNIKFISKLIERSMADSFVNFLILLPAVLFSPIIIILVLSLLFAKGISEPLKQIIIWSEKIKNNDLDFKVDVSYKNEIGRVMEGFEDMRAALENSLKEQWVMAKARKDMILSLTHDIKTPITVICGHLELITGPYPNITEEYKEKSLTIITNNANRVKTLINELNEVWDLEKPDFLLSRKDINLVEFLGEIEDEFFYICNEKSINFSIRHSFNEEECSNFDAFRIEEILENLISNSLRFTNEKGYISIKCLRKDEGLIFQISDSGRGFDEKYINTIFERFYKGQSSENEKNNCGLGLYICKLIVEKHNGWIKAYNNIGCGAIVEFFIK